MVLGNWQRSRGRAVLGLSSQRNKVGEGRSRKKEELEDGEK